MHRIIAVSITLLALASSSATAAPPPSPMTRIVGKPTKQGYDTISGVRVFCRTWVGQRRFLVECIAVKAARAA